ncbi:Chorismate mutase [Pseudodesulfovibrio profundus]|uniref:Bifunctional chorismate mutase/prephenate dehydratase n=1 Tax=Pseudodesulfovibrio profundus TaxID=57320 RepID=A0A2C8FAF4_9BACT|nr:prephenate dehydratase [Pseudodesulfovibrio profundus]MBC15658.1 prephenate dehydratase [Desulfovibrio sp.]SOB59758.1 Chorismate mutase [Pseudodesulfovibrio profundus]|tara:strand:- start:5370 stop:6470 length:1101 start_codon:yes stop_codon:yes gene_type:complete
MADNEQNDIPDLGELRGQIDNLDQQIVNLLNKRAQVSLSVGRYKAAKGESIYKPFREQEVMNMIADSSPGPLPDRHLRTIYREIMSSSRHLQRPENVVYLGPEGTFSYFAAIEHMGSSAALTPKNNFEEIFRAVAEEGAELGVIPLENSIEGTVGQVVDLFMKYKVYIQAEVFSRISHCLMSHADSLDDVEVIYSHPQPLGQCREWLRANMRDVPTIPMESTAEAAKLVASKKAAAVVGHRKLADLHGMRILADSIEDLPDNWTRFLIIGSAPSQEDRRDKTSLLITLPDKPGALARVLTTLAHQSINMTKLESRPFKGEKWKYVFFMDLECDFGGDRYEDVLEDIRHQCHTLRVLGSYPTQEERQ